MDGVEILGYVASALVVLSLTMASVVRLRLISLAGSCAFMAYGVLIGSVPIVITNISIVVINVWFLRKELGGGRDLDVQPIAADAPFLTDFVQFHLPDIHRFQPEFAWPDGTGDAEVVSLLLLRDGLPAGALIGHREGPELHVVLDYVMRAYRDSRLGRWMYGPGAAVFTERGIQRVVTTPGNDTHRQYLERMGFSRRRDGRYELTFA